MHPKRFVSNFWGAVQTLPKGRENSDKPLSGFPKNGNWGGVFLRPT